LLELCEWVDDEGISFVLRNIICNIRHDTPTFTFICVFVNVLNCYPLKPIVQLLFFLYNSLRVDAWNWRSSTQVIKCFTGSCL